MLRAQGSVVGRLARPPRALAVGSRLGVEVGGEEVKIEHGGRSCRGGGVETAGRVGAGWHRGAETGARRIQR